MVQFKRDDSSPTTDTIKNTGASESVLSELLDEPSPEAMKTAASIIASSGLKIREVILRHAGNMAAIAAERALSGEWEEHPMFGIASTSCKDKWAVMYQEEQERLIATMGG